MPKLKKAAKTAYYFFIIKRRQTAEARGVVIKGGFPEASNAFGLEWGQLSKAERAPYEQMAKEAKEEDKHNNHNKFATTGETYAQLHKKSEDQRNAQRLMELCISSLTSGPDSGDRVYIFINCANTYEVIEEKSRYHLPAEIAMAAFSLKGGVHSVYTTLVDPQQVPTGYASSAKESSEDTLLPLPGDSSFTEPTRDYLGILKKIFGFANHWLDFGYDIPDHHYQVFFCQESERQPIISGLQWLVNQLDKDDKKKYQYLLDILKVYRISHLIAAMARESVKVNPSYENYMNEHQAEKSAESIINRPIYDFKDNIGCSFHQSPMGVEKIYNCPQNILLKRIYMMFNEFLPAFKYERTNRHEIDEFRRKIQEPMVVKKRQVAPKKEVKKGVKKEVVEPDWMKEDPKRSPSPKGASGSSWAAPKGSASSSWWEDDNKAEDNGLSEWGKPVPQKVSFQEKDFPSNNGGRCESLNKYGGSEKWTRGGGVSGIWAGRGSSFPLPPQPTRSSGGGGLLTHSPKDAVEFSGFSRRPPQHQTSDTGRGRGLSRAPTSRMFEDQDFPPAQSSGFGAGRGRKKTTDEDDW